MLLLLIVETGLWMLENNAMEVFAAISHATSFPIALPAPRTLLKVWTDLNL